MIKFDGLAGVNDALVFNHAGTAVAVIDDLIDHRFRICRCNDQTHFKNSAVLYDFGLLLQFLCANGKRIDVAVENRRLSGLTVRRVVEAAISSHTTFAAFKNCMAKNIGNLIVAVIPYKGNFRAVTMVKSPFCDGQPIRAQHVALGCPTAKVIGLVIHFDLSPFL